MRALWSDRQNCSHNVSQKVIRKILVSVKFLACNSGARNGCANFMGTWKIAFLLQENRHAHKIPRFRGGYLGGGRCRFYARIFLKLNVSGDFVGAEKNHDSHKLHINTGEKAKNPVESL